MKNQTKTLLLSLTASAGVIGTSVLTAISTRKIVKKENEKDLEKEEKIKLYVSEYAAPVIMGAITIGCIMSSNLISSKYQKSLIGAYGVLDRSYREYRKKVCDILGEEKDEDIKKEVAKDHKATSSMPESCPDGQLIFYDEFSENFFFRTMLEMADAEYQFNRFFITNGYATLNDFYDILGLEPTNYGASVGWSLEAGETCYGYQWIDIEHLLCEEPCDPDAPSYYMIHFIIPPHADYF